MSEQNIEIKPEEKIGSFLARHHDKFVGLNKTSINKLDFAKECEFAKQHLTKSPKVLAVARDNPSSLSTAIINVAAIGISLNPEQRLAFLVPRDKAICLDISYMGFIKLATDTGIVRYLKAEIVRGNDTFIYKGFDKEPVYECSDPFGDSKVIGVFAKARLSDGGVLVEKMSISDIHTVRDSSKGYQYAKSKGGDTFLSTPWVRFEDEQIKKTVIKRAYKTLPKSKGADVLAKAINVVNEHDGIDFQEEPQEPKLYYTDEQSAEYKRCVDEEDYFNLIALERSLCADGQKQLYDAHVPRPKKGMIGRENEKRKEKQADAENALEAAIDSIKIYLSEENYSAVSEVMECCSQWTHDYIMSRLTAQEQTQISDLAA